MLNSVEDDNNNTVLTVGSTPLAKNYADNFTSALYDLESARNIEPIIKLFADNCEIGNVAMRENLGGVEGVHHFWTTYRETFESIHSNFRNKIYSNNIVALEWTTEATSKNGQQINYDGVSILEIDGEKITRFYAYFDPKNLGHQIT